MTVPIRVDVTASISADTSYDTSISLGTAAGLYVGEVSDGSYLLLWFDGDDATAQSESIDRFVEALFALKREARRVAAEAIAEEEASSSEPDAPVAVAVGDADIPF